MKNINFIESIDKDKASKKVAEQFIEIVNKVDNPVFCLPTGNSPVLTYNHIIDDYKKNKTSWKNVRTYNLDEYAGIRVEHPKSFRSFMLDSLFNHIDIDKSKTFFPNPIGDLDKNSLEYENQIKNEKQFDLTLLGIGIDGHIAYNEPGSKINSKTRWVHLHNSTIDLINKDFKDESFVPHFGITMGVETIIKNSNKIILIAFGESKRNALEILKKGKLDKNITATALLKHKNVEIWTDLKL